MIFVRALVRGRSECGQVLVNPKHGWAGQRLAQLAECRVDTGWIRGGCTRVHRRDGGVEGGAQVGAGNVAHHGGARQTGGM